MICILDKKSYEVELNELEQIVGSAKGAYRLLTENNGYTLDKDPWGNPSTLYQELLQKYNGDRKKAILEKSKYYTSKYYEKHGNWTMDADSEPSLQDNAKPKLTFERYFDIVEQREKFIKDKLIEKIRSGKDYTKKQLTYFKDQAIILFNNKKQKELIGSTNQALINAFNLQKIEREDGTFYYASKTSTDGKYDLIVEFVNRLYDEEDEVEGWYDYNAKSKIAHHVIKLALEDFDPSTFDHELAHHYIRMFWNSPLIQDALSAVYEDGMTIEEVEEALVDTIVDRRQVLLNGKKSLFTYKFWNEFYDMLQQAFGRLTGNEREVILNNVKNAFEINQQQEVYLNEIQHSMHEGRMFKRSKYSEQKQKARAESKNKRYNILTSSNKTQQVLDTIINKALRRRNILENAGIISPIQTVQLNKQEQRARQFIEDIENERERYKQELQDSGEWKTGWGSKTQNAKKLGNNKKERELSFDIIQKTLIDAKQDMDEYLEMLSNAETYGFIQTAYVNDESVEDAISRKYIAKKDATGEETVDELSADTLRTVGKETVAYYSKIIDDINSLINSPFASEYFTEEELEDLKSRVEDLTTTKQNLENLYNNGRTAQIQQFIKSMIFVKNEDGKYEVNPILNMEPDEAYAFYDEAMRWVKQSGMDIGKIQIYIGVKEFSKSPITRMLHSLIFQEMQKQRRECEADANRLRTLKRNAKKEALKHGSIFSMLRTFDKIFLESIDGEYTGNILDRVNRGKYLKAKDEWFDNVLYGKGFTYVTTSGEKITYKDNLEKMCRKALSDDSFELELDDKGEPLIPDHLEDIQKAWEYAKEEFYCNNTEREFVPQYYKKRVEMLSPAALKAHKQISSEINKILKLCMVDGKPHTELLTVSQMVQLKDAYKKQGLLSSHYDISGREKEPGTEAYRIMEELIRWKQVYPQISYVKDEESYEESKAASTDPEQFRRQNSYRQVAGFVWDIFKDQLNKDDNSEIAFESEVMGRVVTLKELRSLRSELISTIKEPGIVRPYWELIFDYESGHIREEAKEFLYNLKKLDLAIAEGQQKFEDPNANIAPIKDPAIKTTVRMTVDDRGKKVEVYKDMAKRILQSWKDSGDPDWKTKATEEIQLISYIRKKSTGLEGLSIFSYSKPTKSSMKNPATGEYEKTIQEVPIRIFSKLSKEETLKKEQELKESGADIHPVYNDNYNAELDETIQPNSKYINQDYIKLEKMAKTNPALWEYYEELKKQMKTSFESLPFTGSYNSLAPQIGADWSSYCSRVMLHPTKWLGALKYIYKRFVGITEDDQDVQIQSWIKRNDGSISKKIPVRYIKRLDDPHQINANLLYTVTSFREMAAQYQWRKKINGIALLLYENAYDKRQENHIKELKDLIDQNLYGVDMTGVPTADTNVMWRSMYKGLKLLGITKNLARLGLLGGNVTSGLVAAGDAFCSVIQDVIHGKYANFSDFRSAIGHLTASLPNAMLSFGSTKTNYLHYTDTSTLMNFFGMGESASKRFRNAHHNRFRNILGLQKILMAPFQFADYNTKAMYLEEVLDNVRYIERFKKFMSEDEATQAFMNDGLSQKQAAEEYYKSKTIRSALKIDKFGNVVPSDTKTGKQLAALSQEERDNLYNNITGRALSRTAYYNGMVLDSEKTIAQSNPWASWVSMLRNFMIIMAAHKFTSNDDFFLYRSAEVPPENILDYIDEDEEDFGNSISDEASKMTLEDGKTKIPAKRYAERTQHERKGQYNFLRRDKYAPEIKACCNAFFRQYDVNKDHGIWKRFTHNHWELLKYWVKDLLSKKSIRQRSLNPFHDNLYGSKTKSEKQYQREHQLSYNEISAINTVMCATIMIAVTGAGSIMFHNTYVDDYDDELWFNLIDLILLRIPMEKASGFSFSTVFELVKAVTAGQSPIENFALSSLIYDAVMWASDPSVNEVIGGNGVFSEKRKWEKDLFNTFAILGLKNIHKQTSVPALKATTKFYKDLDLYAFPLFMPANPSLWFKDNKKGWMYKESKNGSTDISNMNFDTNVDVGNINTDVDVSGVSLDF